jgi:hypothetical protein
MLLLCMYNHRILLKMVYTNKTDCLKHDMFWLRDFKKTYFLSKLSDWMKITQMDYGFK